MLTFSQMLRHALVLLLQFQHLLPREWQSVSYNDGMLSSHLHYSILGSNHDLAMPKLADQAVKEIFFFILKMKWQISPMAINSTML